MSDCLGCDRALADGYLCRSCVRRLDDTLGELPWLIDELHVTAYRQDRIAINATGRGSGERPLPFKVHAARLLADVRIHLITYLDAAPGTVDVLTRDPDRASCLVLRHYLDHLAAHSEIVGAMYHRLREDEARMREAIDLPKSFRYLGQCDHCGAELYADRNAELWACHTPQCEATYEVTARMAELLDRARDVVAPTGTIATALTSLEHPVTEELIRKWASRGLLTARSRSGGQSAYRVGDVLDLVIRQRVRQGATS